MCNIDRDLFCEHDLSFFWAIGFYLWTFWDDFGAWAPKYNTFRNDFHHNSPLGYTSGPQTPLWEQVISSNNVVIFIYLYMWLKPTVALQVAKKTWTEVAYWGKAGKTLLHNFRTPVQTGVWTNKHVIQYSRIKSWIFKPFKLVGRQ